MYAHQSISSVHRLGSKRFDRPSYCIVLFAVGEERRS